MSQPSSGALVLTCAGSGTDRLRHVDEDRWTAVNPAPWPTQLCYRIKYESAVPKYHAESDH